MHFWVLMMTDRKNSIVFSPCCIRKIELKNRIVRSATFENAANVDGKVTEQLIEIYHKLAKGGVGLIITGNVSVYSKAFTRHRVLGIYDDNFISGLKKISQTVHDTDSECKIMVQLQHPGRQVLNPETLSKLNPYLPPAYLSYIKRHQEVIQSYQHPPHSVEPTAPSAIFDTLFEQTPRALTLEEINEIIESHAEGIRRAQEAGFDGVQLHAAHGYLLSSFLSPWTNRRNDKYGGSTENRIRIFDEIYEQAKKKVGEDFPIAIKMNTTDFLPGGMDLEEATKVAEILSRTGFAAIETSGGMWEAVTAGREELKWRPVLLPESRTAIKTIDQEAYFLPGAKALKEKTDIPIILVGGLKTFDKIEGILESGSADFVSLARPLIRQPDLPNLWLSDSSNNKAECISCNACLPIMEEPLKCRMKKS